MDTKTDKAELLLFKKPVFKAGTNVTVRLGRKWMDRFEAGLREVSLAATNAEDKEIKRATLLAAAYLPAYIIPSEWLQQEHDPKCKDFNGLYLAMRLAYGDKFTSESMVTVLLFQPAD